MAYIEGGGGPHSYKRPLAGFCVQIVFNLIKIDGCQLISASYELKQHHFFLSVCVCVELLKSEACQFDV